MHRGELELTQKRRVSSKASRHHNRSNHRSRDRGAYGPSTRTNGAPPNQSVRVASNYRIRLWNRSWDLRIQVRLEDVTQGLLWRPRWNRRVHHVTLRTSRYANTATQAPTHCQTRYRHFRDHWPVLFKPLYFREPDSILFEITTNSLGFVFDESLTYFLDDNFLCPIRGVVARGLDCRWIDSSHLNIRVSGWRSVRFDQNCTSIMKQFDSLRASTLYCPKCRVAQPVYEKLLLVLPDREVFDYFCRRCATSVGSRETRASDTRPPLIIR